MYDIIVKRVKYRLLPAQNDPMKLVIAGATGLIGSLLVERLAATSHDLKLLSRKPPVQATGLHQEWVQWQPGFPGKWEQSLEGADGVINLAGEPIAGKRWNAIQKERIGSSRIDVTRAIVNAIAKAKDRPRFLINASAVGYYGHRGDEVLTEENPPGHDFLARVCAAWEEEANKAAALNVRVTLVRTGIVLGSGGGALAKMVTPFKLFAGGPLGSGRQWFPWIHIDDEVGLIIFLAENPNGRGAFNATAPNPVTMTEFCRSLGKALNRPSWAPVPAIALKLLLGEMADMLLHGQRAVPQAAQKLGYKFRYAEVGEALSSLRL